MLEAESWLSEYRAALEVKGLEHLPVFLGAASLSQCCLISLGSARGWCCLGCMFGIGGRGGNIQASAGDMGRGLSTLAVVQRQGAVCRWVKLQE